MTDSKTFFLGVLLHSFKTGLKATESAWKNNFTFREESISERTAQIGFKRFREGKESLSDDE